MACLFKTSSLAVLYLFSNFCYTGVFSLCLLSFTSLLLSPSFPSVQEEEIHFLLNLFTDIAPVHETGAPGEELRI